MYFMAKKSLPTGKTRRSGGHVFIMIKTGAWQISDQTHFLVPIPLVVSFCPTSFVFVKVWKALKFSIDRNAAK